MRVVVIGASGNAGTSLLPALGRDERVAEIVGLARRVPDWHPPKTTWVGADITRDALEPLFEGADAVVHLGWLIQPSRDEAHLRAVNVDGSRRVFEATARAGARALVYASSVGAYSPGPKDRLVDESWPTEGIETSFYARHKAATERMLDELEAEHPQLRVVRLRPALKFKRQAATGIRRLFGGPLVPSPLLRPEFIKLVPRVERLRFQAVHSLDVGEAYRLAAVEEKARGAYNVAADPVLDPDVLAEAFGARTVPVPAAALRLGALATWKLRLQPTPPGWLDMALAVPLMDTSRIRTELGWTPRHTAVDALMDLLRGMSRSDGMATPPLDPQTTKPLRVREILTGIGRREP